MATKFHSSPSRTSLPSTKLAPVAWMPEIFVVGDLLLAFLVDDADVGVVEVLQALALLLRLVDGRDEEDFLDVGGDAGKVDLDHLVLAIAVNGQAVGPGWRPSRRRRPCF